MQLRYGQLEQYWINAGGPKSLAPLMAAIALAESGGRTDAVNRTDNNGTQTSWGLWQISNGTHSSPAPSGEDPFDPTVNAKLAVEKFHSQGLGAWGTYTSGAYKRYYNGSTPAETLPQGGGGVTAGQPTTSTGSPDAILTGFNPVGVVESVVGDVGKLASGGFGILSGTGGVISSTLDAMAAIARSLAVIGEIFKAMLWLVNPANQVRIISGALGLVIAGIAMYFVATS